MKKFNIFYYLLLYIPLFFINNVNAVATQTVTDPDLEKSNNNIYNLLNDQIYRAIISINAASQKQTDVLRQSLSGVGGTNSLFNTPAEQSFRNWTPSSTDLSNMVKEGLQTGSLADQIKYYNERFPIPAPNTQSTHNAVGNYANFAAVNTNAAFSIADKSFDNIPAISQQLGYLYTLIDRPQSLKQGLDINSAILVKIASLQAELMRLQSQQLKMQAVAQQEHNNSRTVMTSFIQDIK